MFLFSYSEIKLATRKSCVSYFVGGFQCFLHSRYLLQLLPRERKCVCVCVCVSVHEGERERGREGDRHREVCVCERDRVNTRYNVITQLHRLNTPTIHVCVD